MTVFTNIFRSIDSTVDQWHWLVCLIRTVLSNIVTTGVLDETTQHDKPQKVGIIRGVIKASVLTSLRCLTNLSKRISKRNMKLKYTIYYFFSRFIRPDDPKTFFPTTLCAIVTQKTLFTVIVISTSISMNLFDDL